jgi:hypothetical protein
MSLKTGLEHDKKYQLDQKIDDADKAELEKWLFKCHHTIYDIATSLDNEPKTSVESKELKDSPFTMAVNMAGLEAKLDAVQSQTSQITLIKDYILKTQNPTVGLGFLESSPIKHDFDNRVRSLLQTASGQLVITGYFDHTLLTELSKMPLKPKIKFISPELPGSKQDLINVDALRRLKGMAQTYGSNQSSMHA